MTPQRIKERAFVLPVLAFVLLVPPFLTLFNKEATLFGLPLLYFYAFAIWTILIIAAWRLTKSLQSLNEQDAPSSNDNGGET